MSVLVLALAALYTPTVVEMVRLWSSHPYAAYAMFMPAVSALALYSDRERLRAAAGRGSATGYVVIGLALGLFGVGHWALGFTVRAVSLVVVITGLALAILGWRWVRAAAFPLGVLILMVPPPLAGFAAITLHVQLFLASVSAGFLALLHVPIVQEGLVLRLPRIRLEIAEACNGLRFLASLVVLAIVFSRFTLPTMRRRLVLVALAVPVGVTANVLRISVTGLAAHVVGPEDTVNFIRYWAGKGIWLLTIGVLIVSGLLLRGGRTANGCQGVRRDVARA